MGARVKPVEPQGLTREECLKLWLDNGIRKMPSAGLRYGMPEVLPRKEYPDDHLHSDLTCLLNYRGQRRNQREWFCETHHQWASEFAVKTVYVFADGETS